jgi:uncharacterized membrane protein
MKHVHRCRSNLGVDSLLAVRPGRHGRSRLARFALSWSFVFALLPLVASSAAMQSNVRFKVCNDFPHDVFVAVAYQKSGRWISDAWWSVRSNTCRTIRTNDPKTYIRGETNSYVMDGKRVHTEWGGDKAFCVLENTKILGALPPCRVGKALMFNLGMNLVVGGSYPVVLTTRFGRDGAFSTTLPPLK